SAIRRVQFRKRRELLSARLAPRRPEIHEDDAALLLRDSRSESRRVELADDVRRARRRRRAENRSREDQPRRPAETAHQTLLMLQPKAFVSAFAIVLFARRSSSAFFRSGEVTLEASSEFSSMRP